MENSTRHFLIRGVMSSAKLTDDFYAILDLKPSASTDDIKKAYRRLALVHHPDKNLNNRQQAEEKFKAISKAYETLSDPDKRREYDLRAGESPSRRASRQSSRNNPFDIDPFFGFGMDPFRRHSRRNADLDDAFSLFERMFGSRDPFSDFFDDPFLERASPQSSSGGTRSSMFGGGSYSASTSSSTKTEGGKRITVTEKKVRYGDGRVETEATEEVTDLSTGKVTKRVLDNGPSIKPQQPQLSNTSTLRMGHLREQKRGSR
jgi:curved DNA-binding protein CbpA